MSGEILYGASLTTWIDDNGNAVVILRSNIFFFQESNINFV